MFRWCWVTLVGLVLGAFVGCSGKAEKRRGEPEPAAGGEAATGTGGGAVSGEGGASGADSVQAGRGGTSGTGNGGTSGAASGAGGAGGASGVAGGAGGTGGAGTLGGSAGMGALGGSAGTTNGEGGGAGGEAVWKCQSSAYADGQTCDCGCGAPDPDCEDSGVESCDRCSQLGGCAFAACPSNIAPDDNARCEVPDAWTCGVRSFGDGFCDCGCGALDSDCEGRGSGQCLSCPFGGCSRNFCETIDPDDNTICSVAPYAWKCPEGLYRDGTCDCACGFLDPDCETNTIEACERCDAEGSCSGLACPGLVAAEAIHECEQPPAPPEWRCSADQYGDGSTCNCGCGVQDPDCRENAPERCDWCDCGPCDNSLHPDDPTQCAPAPPSWICAPEYFSDHTCDCGCGAIDPYCGLESFQCARCEGCAHGHCERIDLVNQGRCTFEIPDGWQCERDVYYDDVCDCGCGALDADCLSANKSECSFCDGEGSCSDVDCADPASTILPNDNTSCSE